VKGRSQVRSPVEAAGRGAAFRPPQTAAAGERGPGAPWPCRHQGLPGNFDETERRANHDELAVAQVLVAEGHQVRTVAEQKGARSPDLMACGTSVEVKGFQSLEQRGGRPPSARSVANKILDARGQGAVAVVRGGESGLTRATAQEGYAMFCERALERGLGRVRAVRLLGKDFDISMTAVADVRPARRTGPATSSANQPRRLLPPGPGVPRPPRLGV
jgi:hypothetical protein